MNSAAGLLSLACLLVTGAIATVGVFSNHYDDNVLQRVGLSIIAIGTISRAVERMANDVPDPPFILLASQVGLALFAVGTAHKVWRAGRAQQAERRGRRGAHA